MKTRLGNFRVGSIGARAACLGVVVLGAFLATAPVAGWLGGWLGLAAAAAAAGFCLAGAAVALLAAYWLRGPKYALHGMLIGMGARMGIPLAAGLVCYLLASPLAEAGLLYYLLVFYPLTLGVETYLSLPAARRPDAVSHLSQDVPS
jgi:hypothetical protein